jgi:hypothetical protein
MSKRKEIEQELAALALDVKNKSSNDAAQATLELYKKFALLSAQELIQDQFKAAQNDLEVQLKERISELSSSVEHAEVTPSLVTISEPDLSETLSPVMEVLPSEQTLEPVKVVMPLFEDPAELDAEQAPPVTTESVAERAQKSEEKKSLNDSFAQTVLKFGLNDRIGYVKHLFDGSTEDFNRVVSQLNTLNRLEEAQDFLHTHVAPDYNWDKQEETAARFMSAVEQRFS